MARAVVSRWCHPLAAEGRPGLRSVHCAVLPASTADSDGAVPVQWPPRHANTHTVNMPGLRRD